MINCPNCGAPVTGHRCAYCETVFDSQESHLRKENELIRARTRYLHDVTSLTKLYEDAIKALRSYYCE